MFVTVDTEIVTQADPNDLWEYAADPAHWTASNPMEHYGLTYFCLGNRPAQGQGSVSDLPNLRFRVRGIKGTFWFS